MYKIVVCEDDTLQAKILCEEIKKLLEKEKVEILNYYSGEDLLKDNLEDVSIYILDINMGQVSGMDVAKEIRKKNDKSEIIFTTSLEDYMCEGYKVRAYRYLLKPIKIDDLQESLLSCIEGINNRNSNYLEVKNRNMIHRVAIHDILYVEVIKRKVIVHTIEQVYTITNSLEKIGLDLKNYHFFRCHKSYLINMDNIDLITKNSVIINDKEVPVSKYKMSDLKTKLTYVLGDIPW